MEASVLCSNFQISKLAVLYCLELIFIFVEVGSFHDKAYFVYFKT